MCRKPLNKRRLEGKLAKSSLSINSSEWIHATVWGSVLNTLLHLCCRMELTEAKKIVEQKKRERMEEKLARYCCLIVILQMFMAIVCIL